MSDTTPTNSADGKSTAPEHQTPSTSAADDVTPGASTPMLDSVTPSKEVKVESEVSKKPTKGSVQIREPPVSETRGYKIVKIEEKHGQLYLAIPLMPLPLSVLCCLFNIVLPGTDVIATTEIPAIRPQRRLHPSSPGTEHRTRGQPHRIP
ncbi:hypothetical protein LSH36_382g02030 [Paralvinella palmiformis]|uniref:Uncharacterized protein n=1 Tax=Paralvinella palmiformis TaxID=53620 RepID=A0AAD9N0W0_9ANNE|nr:hypothetical protein LSH36_382g02030 [Paralvinella palmiformis]